MDVQDFDQFDAIVNETDNGVDSKLTNGANNKKEKKSKLTSKNKVFFL